jgi:ketosteroid isomerase-like protein
MRAVFSLATLLLCSAAVFVPMESSHAAAKERSLMNQDVIVKETVIEFLNRFEQIAEQEDFNKIEAMIHENAFFRFNDGDFVGRQAVRGAFEKTWKGSSGVKKERFYLSDIVVLSTDHSTATATYTYNWEGMQEGRSFRVQGRGTRVLVKEQGRLQIIHEHLSRFPKPQ